MMLSEVQPENQKVLIFSLVPRKVQFWEGHEDNMKTVFGLRTGTECFR